MPLDNQADDWVPAAQPQQPQTADDWVPVQMPLHLPGQPNQIFLPPSDRPESRTYLRSPAYEAEHPGFQPPQMPPPAKQPEQGSMPWSGYGKELEAQHSRDMAVWGAVKDAWQNTPQLLTDLGQKWAERLGLGHSAQALDLANRGFQAMWAGGIEAANQVGEAHGMPLLGRDLAGMVESAGMTGGPSLMHAMRGPEGFTGRPGPYYSLSAPTPQEPIAGELAGPAPQPGAQPEPPPAAAAQPQPQPTPPRPRGMPQQTAQADMEFAARAAEPAQPAPVSPTGQPATPEAAALAKDAQPVEQQAAPVPAPPVAPQPAPVPPVPPVQAPRSAAEALDPNSDFNRNQPITPEPATDIKAQIDALKDPNNPKDAVFIPKGSPLPFGRPKGSKVVKRDEGTLITTNPEKAETFRTAPLLEDQVMGAILGYPETKEAAIASGNPAVVQGTDQQGNVVRESVASPAGVPAAAQAAAQQAPNVQVKTPQEVQARRDAVREWDDAQAAVQGERDRVQDLYKRALAGDAEADAELDRRRAAEADDWQEVARELVLPYERVPKEPERLASFLVRMGGVKDVGGDIRSTLGGSRFRPGLINNKKGLPLDEATLRAWQSGYFPDAGETRPSINDLRDALDDDLKNMPRYSSLDQGALEAFETANARNSEIDRLAAEHDIDTRGKTQEQFFDELRDKVSFEEFAREMTSQAAAAEEAYREAERQAKQTQPGVWNAKEFYGTSQARTLEDLEREYASETQSGPLAGPVGELYPGIEERGAPGEYQGAVPEGGEARPGGAPNGRGAEAGSLQAALEQRRTPVPGQADIFTGETPPPPAPKREAEPTIRNDTRQIDMFGKADAAVQTQAARDQQGRGMLTGKGEQKPADEGLFAEKEAEQRGLFQGALKPGSFTNKATLPLADFPKYTPDNVHQVAMDWVFHHGRQTGHEHLVIVHEGKVIHAGTDHDPDTVSIQSTEPIDAEPRSLILHHNHTINLSFSQADHVALAAHNIGTITAVGPGGEIYVMSPSETTSAAAQRQGYELTAAQLREAWKNGSDIAAYLVADAIRDGHVKNADEAATLHDAVVGRLMDATGYTHYMTNQALPPPIAERLRAVLRMGDIHDETELDRLTGSVRNEEAFASLSRPMGEQPGGGAGPNGTGRGGAGEGLSQGRSLGQTPAGDEGEEGTRLYSFPGSLIDPAAWRRAAAPIIRAVSNPRNFIAQSARMNAIMETMADGARAITSFAQLHVTPMAHGSAGDEARAMAKDWANLDRLARWEGNQTIAWGRKTFTADQRRNMWDAADADSVYMQQQIASGQNSPPVRLAPGYGGIADLTPEEQGAILAWQDEATKAFDLARRVGIHNAVGLPSYVPRMIVDTVNGIRKRFGQGGPGAQAEIVRDILNLPLATMRLRQAIAGRVLVNQIQAYGQRIGQKLVREGNEDEAEIQTISRSPNPGGPDIVDFGNNVNTTTPQMKRRKYTTAAETEAAANRKRDWMAEEPFEYFTIKSNPAFWTWRWGGTDQNGDPWFKRVPIFVRSDFEGPLRAIMNNVPAGLAGRAMQTTYGGLMDLKGRMMTSIMYGVAHLGVVTSRAMPAARTPWNFARMWRAGATAKDDPATMRELILAGMAPIGSRMGFRDLAGMIDDPQLAPGRSWTSKLVGFVPGIFSARAGEAARSGIDALGDFMHNRLLWDQVQSIQVGLTLDIADKMEQKGYDRQTALRVGARFGNNYVGAIPREAMSQWARGIANMALFSRSYRGGNLAAIKDAFTGFPRDVQAQIKRDAPQFLKGAVSYAKRKAWTTLALDIGFALIASGIIQNLVNIGYKMGPDQEGLPDDASIPQRAKAEMYGYWRRMMNEMQAAERHPFDALNPFSVMENLTPMGEHEPGKKNRLLLGYDNNGTGIYARLPVGKVYEDLTDYWTQPRDILKRMLSPYAQPISEWWTNETGFGQQIWDPLSDTPSDMVHGMWKWTKLIMEQPFPWATNIYNAMHNEQGAGMTALQIAGGAIGLSISHGMPGGPEVGKVFNAQKRVKFQQQEAMPQIRELIRGGDLEGARKQMNALHFPPWQQRAIERSTLHPGLSRSQKRFEATSMGDTSP